MTFDFRASQLRTSKIIVSGSTGTNAKLLLYPIAVDGTPANQGNIDTAMFPTGSIGQDAFIFISGAIGGRNGTDQGTTVFGGDAVFSGSVYSEQAIEGLTVSAPSIRGNSFTALNSSFYFLVTGSNPRFGVAGLVPSEKAGIYSQTYLAMGCGSSFSGSFTGSLTNDVSWSLPDESGNVLIDSRVLAGTNISLNTYAGGYLAISGVLSDEAVWESFGNNLEDPAKVDALKQGLGITPSPIDFESVGTALSGTGTSVLSGTTVTLSASTSDYLPTTAWTGPRGIVYNKAEHPASWRMTARVASLTGDYTTYLVMGVVNETADYFCGISINPDYLRAEALGNFGGFQTQTGVVNDGTLWVEVERRCGTVSLFFGQGTTTTPPSGSNWTLLKISSFLDNPGADLVIGLQTGASASAMVDNVYFSS